MKAKIVKVHKIGDERGHFYIYAIDSEKEVFIKSISFKTDAAEDNIYNEKKNFEEAMCIAKQIEERDSMDSLTITQTVYQTQQ